MDKIETVLFKRGYAQDVPGHWLKGTVHVYVESYPSERFGKQFVFTKVANQGYSKLVVGECPKMLDRELVKAEKYKFKPSSLTWYDIVKRG